MGSRPSSEKIKTLGAVYTPSTLASWLITCVKNLGITPTRIFDPAAGEGALLLAAKDIFPSADFSASDIDSDALKILADNGFETSGKPENALRAKSWGLKNPEASVLVFSNPPWGALISAQERDEYSRNFLTARGQFDTFDLFVEKTIQELPDGGHAALFLPDSILLPQHRTLRSLILSRTTIRKIVRLPEGTFPNVAIGSIALILEKTKPTQHSKILSSRISRSDMLKFGSDLAELSRLENAAQHLISQDCWKSDPLSNWSLDVAEDSYISASNLSALTSQVSAWDEWFTSGRGLELGKKSELLRTNIQRLDSSKYVPVAVGEDLHRRVIQPSRYIPKSAPGVRFKSELSNTKRLFVRKTGIGIKAAVGFGFATTQTIYHFTPLEGAPQYALHYAAGFLTSRVIIALHLARTGETEWRSHPYVTQKSIKELPLPLPQPESEEEFLAVRLAEIHEQLSESASDFELELEADLLVAKLLGHGSGLVDWAEDFLSTISGCSYAKDLSEISMAPSLVA